MSDKDWITGQSFFRREVVEKGNLCINDFNVIYVLSGKIVLSYVDKHLTDVSNEDIERQTVKTLESGDLCCIFDMVPIDTFDPDRNLQLHLSCTEVGKNGTAECIAVSRENFTEFLSQPHLHTLKNFFEVRCVYVHNLVHNLLLHVARDIPRTGLPNARSCMHSGCM